MKICRRFQVLSQYTNSNAEALVVATRKMGLEVSADKIKYMVMSRHQNAGHHKRKIDNSFFGQYKYLGTDLTNQILFRNKLTLILLMWRIG